MTIEEFLNATIPATQPNQFGVYVEDTPIEIANAKNKQLIVRCAYNGKEYLFSRDIKDFKLFPTKEELLKSL